MGTRVIDNSTLESYETKKDLFKYPTVGEFYNYGYNCCENCNNNPKNNPFATGVCNCTLPYMRTIK